MSHFILLSLVVFVFAGLASSHMSMGAASLLWPPSRSWDDNEENHSPCGTAVGSGDRTNFTYYRGHIIILTQAKALNLRISVSHWQDPKSSIDFDPMMKYDMITEVDAGITCINIPNAPGEVKEGQPATLQLKYNSEFGSNTGRNKTFYSCADITYVAPEHVPYDMPCFNTTQPKVWHYKSPINTHKPQPPKTKTKTKIPEPEQPKDFTPGGEKKRKLPDWAKLHE
ncbi:hypothetical protein V8C35DRAFT_277730 [Trichoderma chlorosporum]